LYGHFEPGKFDYLAAEFFVNFIKCCFLSQYSSSSR
jgi:hypothetical protein